MEDIEMLLYSRLCSSCPHAKQCHEDCETCEKYDAALEEAQKCSK